jgi:hypothetical protein
MTAFFHQSRSLEGLVLVLDSGFAAVACPIAVRDAPPRSKAAATTAVFLVQCIAVSCLFPLLVDSATVRRMKS